MRNPFKRERKAAYVHERERLLTALETHTPDSDEYQKVMNRLDQLDQILNSPAAVAFRESLDVATNPVCQKCVCSLNWRSN